MLTLVQSSADVEGTKSNPADQMALEATADQSPTTLSGAIDTVVSSLYEMWNDFLLRLPLFAVALLVLVATWMLARAAGYVVRSSLSRTHLRGSLRDLIRQVVYLAVWIVGLLVAAVVIFPGMTPAKVLTVLGLGSIAIGFAFKDIVENFFAGVLILWRFPFEKGDYIECGEIRGKVVETTIRMTTLRQVDGQLVALPNAQLFKMPVNVITSRPLRRITLVCGVDYDTNLDEAGDSIKQAVQQCQSVSQDEPIDVFAKEFGASSINFEVTWWSGSKPHEVRKSRDQVLRAIKREFDAAGISIPFPHRTIHFKEGQPTSLDESQFNSSQA